MSDKEYQILVLVKKHDRVAQKQLYYAYVKLVSYIALRYVNDNNYAQDIIQNTFVRIFTNIGKYDSEKGNLKSWISRIAVNESIAFLRSHYKIDFINHESVKLVGISDYDNNTLDRLELEDVKKIVNMMNPADRIIFDLFYFEEYSHKEIAEELNISIGSSRTNLHRAKKKFNALWKKINKNEIRGII